MPEPRFRSWHDTLSEFDVEGHLPELFYSFRSNPFRFRLRYMLDYFDVDSDSYQRGHVGELRFGPGYQTKGYTDFYLHSRGRANTPSGDGLLTQNPPSPGGEPPDRYVYDPRDPVMSAKPWPVCAPRRKARPRYPRASTRDPGPPRFDSRSAPVRAPAH